MLHRHRNDGLCLDTTLALTRWMALVPAGALLATFAPATGVYTYVAKRDGKRSRVIGQFMHPPGSPYAKLTFITPEEDLDSPLLPELLDYMAARAGERGAHNLLAEVNDRSTAFELLRKAGFAIYTRQRIWRLTGPAAPEDASVWRPAVERDSHNLHHLYTELVPPLVQQTEPAPDEKMSGLVYEKDGEMLGYLHLSYGPKGILAQPFLHPDTTEVELVLRTVYASIPNPRTRPIYLCVRSHHAWLAAYLDGLGDQSEERQAVMVKRLAKVQKASLPLTLPAAGGLESAQPNASSTVLSAAQHESAPAMRVELECN